MNGSKCLFNLSGAEKMRIAAGTWGDLEDNIIVGKDNGTLEVIELRKEGVVKRVEAHKKIITDIQKHVDGTMFLTASKDHTAKVGLIFFFIYALLNQITNGLTNNCSSLVSTISIVSEPTQLNVL